MRPTAYRRNARGFRDRQAFERIRLQAGALFAAGRSQTEVAHQLGVSRQNVSRWHTRWRAGGQDALRSAGPTGCASRLSDQQLHDLKQALRQGAHVHGFDTDHWTLARIATVIQQMTGIGYHPGHVWRLLRRRLGWRLQRPARRAVERDEQAIARWVESDWPRIRQNARRRRATLVFWDESGISLLPVTRRTWAPRGHTPVVRHHFNWKRTSMAAALCYGSRGGGASLAFHHQVDAYNTNSLIGALDQLHRTLGGEKATLLWDGLPAHRSKTMQAWLGRQRRWLVVEPLPGYAPELNPVEALWSNLKGVELANLAADTVHEATAAAQHGIQRIRQTHHLAYSFLRHCGLSLW
jgi:transposase